MKNVNKRKIVALLIPGLMLISFQGCRIFHPSNQHKVEKKQQEAAREADKEYEKAKKQHLDNQNKETKLMIKKTRKKAERVNQYKKRGFLQSKRCR
jgi:hypothetical protein